MAKADAGATVQTQPEHVPALKFPHEFCWDNELLCFEIEDIHSLYNAVTENVLTKDAERIGLFLCTLKIDRKALLEDRSDICA
jgi:hypothetical protein